MTSAHLISNSTVCDNTFLCPRRLFSSPINSWLYWPQSREATNCQSSNLLGYIRSLEWARIISLTSAAASTTPPQDLPSPPPLLLLLDVPCPDLKSLFLCRLARVHQEDRSSCIRKSTHSQERACKCTFDFHSQVKSLLNPSQSGRLVTVAQTSFLAQSSCSCELDTATWCHTSCCAGRPLWAGLCSLRGAVAAQLLLIGATRPVGQDALTG